MIRDYACSCSNLLTHPDGAPTAPGSNNAPVLPRISFSSASVRFYLESGDDEEHPVHDSCLSFPDNQPGFPRRIKTRCQRVVAGANLEVIPTFARPGQAHVSHRQF